MKTKRKKYLFNAINVYKIRKKDKLFAFFVIIIIFLILYIKHIVMPIVVNNTDAQLRSLATRSINYAVADTLNKNVNYGKIL